MKRIIWSRQKKNNFYIILYGNPRDNNKILTNRTSNATNEKKS